MTSVQSTTSPDGSGGVLGIAHMGWESVHEAIGSLQETGRFQSCNVRAFIRQYLELVERWFRPTGAGGFMTLLGDYSPFLENMRQVLDTDGEDGIRRMVPEDRTSYSEALVRLVNDSKQAPVELRAAVAARLREQGFKLHFTQIARQGNYWLNWINTDLADAARRLGCGDFLLSWGMHFTHQEVGAGFYLYRRRPEEQVPPDRIKGCMQSTPINRLKPDDYVMRDAGYGWCHVYSRVVLSKDKPFAGSRLQIKDEVIRRLEHFIASDDAEYRRIQGYFQCLAFGTDGSASARVQPQQRSETVS